MVRLEILRHTFPLSLPFSLQTLVLSHFQYLARFWEIYRLLHQRCYHLAEGEEPGLVLDLVQIQLDSYPHSPTRLGPNFLDVQAVQMVHP